MERLEFLTLLHGLRGQIPRLGDTLRQLTYRLMDATLSRENRGNEATAARAPMAGYDATFCELSRKKAVRAQRDLFDESMFRRSLLELMSDNLKPSKYAWSDRFSLRFAPSSSGHLEITPKLDVEGFLRAGLANFGVVPIDLLDAADSELRLKSLSPNDPFFVAAYRRVLMKRCLRSLSRGLGCVDDSERQALRYYLATCGKTKIRTYVFYTDTAHPEDLERILLNPVLYEPLKRERRMGPIFVGIGERPSFTERMKAFFSSAPRACYQLDGRPVRIVTAFGPLV
jgi:hypothetical protein